jgi:hypothetical protein
MSKIYLLENKLMGAVANNAVRQSPYPRPDNLEVVLDKYHKLVGPTFKTAPMGCAELTDEDLDQLIHLLREIPEYNAWNERKNGNKADFKFVDRYSTDNNPDDDFIDLDALERNVFNDCTRET